jgi:hypothetical protein
LIRIGRRPAAQNLLQKQNHTDNDSELLRDPDGSPCETFIKSVPHLDEDERVSHHPWLTDPELQGLNTHQTQDLLASDLAHIWDDGGAEGGHP